MEPGGSMPHSQGSPIIHTLSRINPFPAMIPISSRPILILSAHLRLGVAKGLFPVGLPVKILKAPSSILATCPAHLNLLDLITLTILGESTNYEFPHCEAFSPLHSHPSWAQLFASRSCFQIP